MFKIIALLAVGFALALLVIGGISAVHFLQDLGQAVQPCSQECKTLLDASSK